MQTKTREMHVKQLFDNLAAFLMERRGKSFPVGELIEQHTLSFVKNVLGYSNTPIYFNTYGNEYLALFENWRDSILNRLVLMDQRIYDKCNGNDEHDLMDTIDYIEAI